MAEAAAAVRAAHRIYEESAIFDDPYAIQLTSPSWRFIAQNKFLYNLIVKRVLPVLRPAHGQVLARSQYTEDRLTAAISSGITQYVILAAGLDSFAIRRRDLASKLKIFEIDHPGTQQQKQVRLQSMGITKPSNLDYLPLDFKKKSLTDVLLRSSFDPNQPAFFSWLGTIPYLTQDVVFKSLKDIFDLTVAGTEIVFDYANTRISEADQPAVQALMKFAERRGEPLITQFDAEQFGTELEKLGYAVIENISQSVWRDHYYEAPQIADLRPLSAAYIAHLRVGDKLS